MTELGLVSRLLEAELRTKTRQKGIVVWLDPDSHYSPFVEQLIRLRGQTPAAIPYPVHTYRGSFLELILTLESVGNGVDRPPLLIHLPGFNRDTVQATPLLEFYAAGTSFEKSLEKLIGDAAAGLVLPQQIEAFQASGRVSLGNADQWLAAMTSVQNSQLAVQLRHVTLTQLVDDLIASGSITRQYSQPGNQDAIWQCIATLSGLSPELGMTAAAHASNGTILPKDVAFAVASWAMQVEYVHDLKRLPFMPELLSARHQPETLVENCRELAKHLRLTPSSSSFYRQTANETEIALHDEREAATAEDLGEVDTFWFEEDKVFQAALQALVEQRWSLAADWASQRTTESSFWLRDDAPRRNAWQLIGDAARLGAAIEQANLSMGKIKTVEEAVERYVACGATVDQAHRHLEQRRHKLLHMQLPNLEQLQSRLDELRVLWRMWADSWARQFNEICQSQGFLPPAAMQQRTLFEDVIRPLIHESKTTVLFLVDAFRFEMAAELQQLLTEPDSTNIQLNIQLGARLAELPTITAIGMNALAPVADRGRMKLVLKEGSIGGFDLNQFRVINPETRKKAFHDRVGGATCPWLTLEEVLGCTKKGLNSKIGRANLVIVHSQEIDEAGEKGAGLDVFDTVLQKLRAAWRIFRDAKVQQFVVTADHGFLLNDPTTARVQTHGRQTVPNPRYVISPVAADHANEVRVPLQKLGYDGDADKMQLMMPESTALFDRGNKPKPFVHGGNSLQERVIPVLTLVHHTAKGGRPTQYVVSAEGKQGVAGMNCLKATVTMADQKTLGFTDAAHVELGLRVSDSIDAQVELCEARGAQLTAGTITTTVGQEFELFFRLAGATDTRVQVELYHLGSDADVVICRVKERFGVTATGRKLVVEPNKKSNESSRDWLQSFEDTDIRQLFEHLAVHGAVTEEEASKMLGGQRAARKFAGQFEALASNAPFSIRIDVIAGVKRYVREGTQ